MRWGRSARMGGRSGTVAGMGDRSVDLLGWVGYIGSDLLGWEIGLG